MCLQFSCASPSHSCPDSGCEVWVCNSDGYVGQVGDCPRRPVAPDRKHPLKILSEVMFLICFLSAKVCLLNIKDEPTVEACIAVCSARIICIAAVPGLKGRLERTHAQKPFIIVRLNLLNQLKNVPLLILFVLLL